MMKSKASLSQMLSQPTRNITKSAILYQTCDKLPLDLFQDCLLDNDLTVLIISGTPGPEQLTEVWNKIYVQYCELSQAGQFNQVFDLTKEIEDIRAKIVITDLTIKHLQIGYDKELVDVLNTMALMCDIGPDDTGIILINKLNGVVARMKKWFPKLTQRQKELDEIRAANNTKTDRAYFDEWLEIMSESKGYQVEASKITVSRFCLSMNKIKERAMQQEIEKYKHAS